MTTMNNEDPADPSAHEARGLDWPEPVAYLHDIVAADGEPDQALSFAPDNFPLMGVGGFRSVAYRPLYTADQMREAIAAERERSHELLQAADHIHAGLDAELAALRAAVNESERERDHLRWRMREIIPLFEEARDALCAISLVAATAYRVDLSLGSRMDAAGTRTREEFDAMLAAAEKEQPK